MSSHMPQSGVDVLIVGGGPAGLYAAERMARLGHSVLVCEEHDAVGSPVHCTGILASESFVDLALPAGVELNALSRARFVSPSGLVVDYETPRPLATVIDRVAFDRALADRACAAGAEIRRGVRVSSLEASDSAVTAIAGDACVRARLAVLACGASYGFQRRFGLGLPQLYLHTAQRELPARRVGDVELHFGRSVARDGFAWAVPVLRADGLYARVGAMASDDALGAYTRMLARVADDWGLSTDDAAPRQKVLPLGEISRTYGDRLLVVGDAAGLVKPTTGGGIHYSILSAGLAADVADRALRRDRLDAGTLSEYEQCWRADLAEELESQHALRRVVTSLDDTEVDSLFDLAQTDGIMPLVRKTAQFNQHRHLIRALFKHPPARRILFRSLVG
jgi:digeranylgeranylglycerophospholipid reductase